MPKNAVKKSANFLFSLTSSLEIFFSQIKESINPQKMFWKQISMFGSTMGNDQEFNEMIQFVNKNKIKHVVEKCWKLSEGAMAFDYMNQAKQFGKIVLTP